MVEESPENTGTTILTPPTILLMVICASRREAKLRLTPNPSHLKISASPTSLKEHR